MTTEVTSTDAGSDASTTRSSTLDYEAISRAAYYRAQQRNFEPGHEVEDWLAAEREFAEREGAGVIG